jgi:hypothetical protein
MIDALLFLHPSVFANEPTEGVISLSYRLVNKHGWMFVFGIKALRASTLLPLLSSFVVILEPCSRVPL